MQWDTCTVFSSSVLLTDFSETCISPHVAAAEKHKKETDMNLDFLRSTADNCIISIDKVSINMFEIILSLQNEENDI